MSLLLDALKKAADAKAEKLKKADGVNESLSSNPININEFEEAGTDSISPNVYALPNAELNAIDSVPTKAGTTHHQSYHEDFDPEITTSSADAQAFFASKVQRKSLPRRPNFSLIIAFILFIFLLSALVYFYYIQKENDLQQQLHQATSRVPIVSIERAILPTQQVPAPVINKNQQTTSTPKITQSQIKKDNPEQKADQAVSQNGPTALPVPVQKTKITKPTTVKVKQAKPRLKEERRIAVVINESLRPADQLALKAYKAYKTRDFEAAKRLYKQAISVEPKHYDALLGLATTSTLLQDKTLATATYQEILRHYPNDPAALANLNQILAQGQVADIESELISLLDKQPGSAPLNFTLGNFYSQRKRWSDAQAAYFKAYSKHPDNPDYAYNLAVSLDHLGKFGIASEYYQKSLKNARQYPTKFNPDIVRKRLSEIR